MLSPWHCQVIQIATRTSQRQSKNSTQTWLADQKTNHVLQKKHNLENYPSKKSTSKSQNEHQPFCPPEHQKKHQTSTKQKHNFENYLSKNSTRKSQKKHQQITKLAPGKAQDVLGQSCTQLSLYEKEHQPEHQKKHQQNTKKSTI